MTCQSKLKLKKLWSKTVIDHRYSFLVNDDICELASRHWQMDLNIDGASKIYFNCKMALISGNRIKVPGKKRGRPTVREGGFVTVCCKCHAEVNKTYRKHICTTGSAKRNVKEIIKNSFANSSISNLVQKQSQKPPNFIATSDDLLLHQSVSRLSSRQMYKQTQLWKKNLQHQGFKVAIAGQKKIDQLRKERVDDLFVTTDITTNTGTEKNHVWKKN